MFENLCQKKKDLIKIYWNQIWYAIKEIKHCRRDNNNEEDKNP